jgi:hypothetical protein
MIMERVLMSLEGGEERFKNQYILTNTLHDTASF